MHIRLPWSDHINLNILEPCILCRNERAPVCGKYCPICYKELLTNIIIANH